MGKGPANTRTYILQNEKQFYLCFAPKKGNR